MRSADTDLPGASTPPRLFAIDVDGTLLTSRHEVTPASVAAVGRVRARGVEIVLTTSRPPRALWPILAALGLADEASGVLVGERTPAVFIGSQGALVGSYSAGGVLQVLDQQPMPVALARQAVAVGARAGASVNWYAGERWLVPRIDDLIRREAAIVGCEPELGDLSLETQGPDKILLIAPDGQRDLLEGVAAGTPSGLVAVTSNPTYLEITRAGVDKAGALARHCARRGIPTTAVVAIGDGRNDLGMLELAGLAIAPANAHPEVLRIADLITASNDEDGVARALDLLVP